MSAYLSGEGVQEILTIGQWNGLLQFQKKNNQNICALGTTINYFFWCNGPFDWPITKKL